MAVEEIELRLTVDGRPAQKALDEVRATAQKLGGGLEALKTGFGEMQKRIAPAAAAISGVAGALGQTNGEAGKAIAAIGQVTAAFAAGGPFGAALAAGTFAVDSLSQAWERELKAQQDAITARYEGTEKVIAQTKQLEEEAARLRLQLEPLSASEIRSRAANQIREMEKTERKQARDAQIALIDGEQDRAAKLTEQNTQLSRQRALIYEIADIQATLLERQQAGARGGRGARPAAAAEVEDSTVAMLLYVNELKLKAQNEYLSAKRDATIDEVAQIEEPIDMEVEGMLYLKEQREKASREYLDLKRKEAQELVPLVLGPIDALTSASEAYVDARIKGEENAEAAFISSITKQAGQALISYGTQAIGRGILEASSPVTAALAPASFAAGAGLVAGGIALGGVATGIMHVAQGGTVGQPVPQSTSGRATDPGARARPSSGARSSSGGGTNVTIIYGGISGPSADDGARALRKAATRADRRGFA